MKQHTATPWEVSDPGDDEGVFICKVGELNTCLAAYVAKEDADFIVRACNTHESLVEACKSMVEAWDKTGPIGYVPFLAIQRIRLALLMAGEK